MDRARRVQILKAVKLEEYGKLLAYEAAFWSQGVINPTYPIDEMGKLSLEVSDKFRVLAIITLVMQGESDFYCHNLIRSGRSREAYLLRLHQESIEGDHHGCSGRYEALLDSVAAGDLALARHIADLSPGEFREQHEYEDDYCYAQCLHRLIREEPPRDEFRAFFVRWAAYLDGKDTARLRVCKALSDRDQNAFDEAFEALLDEQQAKIEADKERDQLEDPSVVAKRRVFVEGLALLRLADQHGLRTQREYRYCPSLARAPMRNPFPGE
jgi:Immunity protein 49